MKQKEPLKDKIECFDGRVHKDGKHFKDCDMYFSVQDTKLAVEWLKEQLIITMKPQKGKICWNYTQVGDLIDKAFPDLNTS